MERLSIVTNGGRQSQKRSFCEPYENTTKLHQNKLTIEYRDVAQLGSAPRLGRGGRTFKSCHPDHLKKAVHIQSKRIRDIGFYNINNRIFR